MQTDQIEYDENWLEKAEIKRDKKDKAVLFYLVALFLSALLIAIRAS